ncbi:MAG: hypothetical protein BroJett011_04530 [Chloroflexota bacterium]|nr:MAG: hypothetical protein BroJett011_04530 [Chloroflexota bacterium]
MSRDIRQRVIPDTNEIGVAKIAVALQLVTAGSAYSDYRDNVQAFVNAYEVVNALIGAGKKTPEVQELLDKLMKGS